MTISSAFLSITKSLKNSEKKDHFHAGVLQCKDSFYGQHDPDSMPVSHELNAKWEAWVKCGALASEMESACLFILGSVRHLRTGSIMTVFANQTRRALGLDDPQSYDSTPAIKIAVEAIRILIQNDHQKQAANA